MTVTPPNSDAASEPDHAEASGVGAIRDIGEVPAVEVVTTVALHLMSAAAVKVGLGDGSEDHSSGNDAPDIDLDEARTLIIALAGLITASAPRLGTFHAAPLRDGLRTLQLAFREASTAPDAPGSGPGEDLTGPVFR
jgi:hypothetical protein